MAQLHQINCATNRRNSGYGSCGIDWQLIKGCFLFDSPTSLDEAQLANLQEELQTMAWQDDKSGRCYPIHNFLNPQDNTDDPTIESFSDGSKAFVRDGVYDWTFQITAGAFCLLQSMRTHNGNNTCYAFFYDANKQILGYNNSGFISAIPLMVFQALPWKMNTGSNVTKYLLRFIFATNYANEDSDFTKADFPLTNIVGLQDIKLLINGFNHTTGVASVSVITECGGSNLFGKFETDLESNSLWVATNAATGDIIPILSVTPILGSNSFNVAMNTGNANYPTNDAIFLSLAAPSVLDAAGISGYESEQAELTVISS